MAHFRAMTLGNVVIIGRKTFESIGKPLPGSETIVVTRDPSFHPEGVHVVHSLEAAMDLAAVRARDMNAAEIIIAGGGEDSDLDPIVHRSLGLLAQPIRIALGGLQLQRHLKLAVFPLD